MYHMNKQQTVRTEMFNNVVDFLNQHHAIWEGTKIVSDSVAELGARHRLILQKLGRQLTPSFAATQEKDQVRLELELMVLQMANNLAVLAAKTDDFELAGQSEFNLSTLGSLSKDGLDSIAERIHQLLVERLPGFADYGITEADAAGLAALLQKFRSVKTAPRNAILNRVGETTTLPVLIRSTSRFLRVQLDKLMVRFRLSNPEFYTGYLKARQLIDRGARRARPTTTPATPAPTPSQPPPATTPTETARISS